MNDSARASRHALGDYAYDAIYVGGIGGGIVALFFLLYDVVAHRGALFTPSLIGSVLFDGADPSRVQSVDMMAVAKYTAVHFIAFGAAGIGFSLVTHLAELRARHPALVIAFAFLVLELGFWLGTRLVLPGVLIRIGVLPVAAANLLAAVGVGLFLVISHRPAHWINARRVTHG